MPYRETVAVFIFLTIIWYRGNRGILNSLNNQIKLNYINIQFVPRSKHIPSTLYKPISQCCTGKKIRRYVSHTKHTIRNASRTYL